MSTTSDRPVALVPVFDSIPIELRETPAWVLWRYELDGKGKWTKPPCASGGGRASTTNPDTWATFDAVRKRYDRGGFDGIGIVLTNGIAGIDVDKCINDDEIEAWAVETLDRFPNTYRERSPSGRGYHILTHGTPGRCGKGGPGNRLEVYAKDSPRYFTVTGHALDDVREIVDGQDALDWLHATHMAGGSGHGKGAPADDARQGATLSDDAVIAHARKARNGGKFADLWAGGHAGHASASDADAALVGILMFYTQDPVQLDRLFRRSGLMRDKWDEPRGETTYGAMTIANILAKLGQHFGDRTQGHRSHANGAEGIDTHADAQEAPEGDSGPPIDILRTAAAPPLRPDDVPPVLGRFAATQAQATGFDVSILIAAGIGAAAAMLTDEVRLLVDSRAGWFESGRLWLALVAGPGAGKSPGMKAAAAPVFDVHREEVAKWAQAKDNAADEEPPMPALYVSDATTEALSEVLRANERGILYFTDELEAWLASHDAYRSAGGKDRGEWLRLYDGGPHQVNRVKRGAFFVKNWGASLLSATTPAALGKLASKLPTDGLLQRFILVRAAPMTLPTEDMLRVETRAPREAWDTALRRVYAIGPATVRLSVEAAATFATERAELHELTQAFEESSPSLAAHLAKRAAMLARLALVYHALEAPAIETPVSGETMARAARFMRRQERHAFAVYGLLVGADSGMTLAKDMARSILAGGIESFNRREIAHRCKAFRHADEPTRQGALTMLRDCGWIAPEGHPLAHGAQWHVDARVHELYAEHGEAARRRRALVRARIQAREEDDE